MGRVLVTVLLLASGCWTSVTAPDGPHYAPGGDWIVSPSQARSLLQQTPGATLLDARAKKDFDHQHVKGSRHVDWLRFTRSGDHERGLLLADDSTLTERLRALDVSSDRRVLVIGDSTDGWGEDGRVVWMLRTLGHKTGAMVDGGYDALVEEGIELTDVATPSGTGDFEVNRTHQWLIEKDELQQIVSAGGPLFVDTRSRGEYDGATPYGETRGGHLPGAIHLHYRDLLNTFGALRARQQITSKLTDLGASPQKPTVVYCTGGVRSAWFVVLLMDMGYQDVRNYSGSMWEWAAGPVDQFPLE